jgi:pullulanase/glycogen debranching enzyme
MRIEAYFGRSLFVLGLGLFGWLLGPGMQWHWLGYPSDYNGEAYGTGRGLRQNHGAEGGTNDPKILSLRNQQAKNFMAILLLSQGVPMILTGDEVLRTQRGNNNGYCQDNELSWFDWTLTEKSYEMLRFVKEMIAFRKRHPSLMRKHFLTGKKKEKAPFPDVTWHGIKLNEPLWHVCRRPVPRAEGHSRNRLASQRGGGQSLAAF